ncbi:hypothetical protein [Nocardiopsis aegyptia]|uniref:Uncharacterized protein n=1 Tax=Nocardiopsis aegyptia TaxID=220378 RepID=A0A7Z0JC14_9ACTN|nr:hypothetical protein [Nocardiopsis aegyptia]NYJ36888.1 hypothetical protein [Nocardiopsis aegyptia]
MPASVLLAAATGCSLWEAPEQDPPATAVETPTASPTEVPEPERGGLAFEDPEAEEPIEFVGMHTGGRSTILLYTADFTNAGTYDPAPAPEEGTERAELDVTSVETRDGSVVLAVEAAYLDDGGELTVHADDFLGVVLPDGYASAGEDAVEEYRPEEEGVLAVIGPREPSADFPLTFEDLPALSLFRYEVPAGNIDGYDETRHPGPATAITCLEVDGAQGRVWSQDGETPCDLAWM